MHFRCNACDGEYNDPLTDGTHYYHACPDKIVPPGLRRPPSSMDSPVVHSLPEKIPPVIGVEISTPNPRNERSQDDPDVKPVGNRRPPIREGAGRTEI